MNLNFYKEFHALEGSTYHIKLSVFTRKFMWSLIFQGNIIAQKVFINLSTKNNLLFIELE